MKEDKTVVDAYPCDGDMAKRMKSILFKLGRKKAIDEKSNRVETWPGLNYSCT